MLDITDNNLAYWRINLQTRVDGSEAGIQPVPMTIFDACGVFMAFLEARPCWQPWNEVWPEVEV